MCLTKNGNLGDFFNFEFVFSPFFLQKNRIFNKIYSFLKIFLTKWRILEIFGPKNYLIFWQFNFLKREFVVDLLLFLNQWSCIVSLNTTKPPQWTVLMESYLTISKAWQPKWWFGRFQHDKHNKQLPLINRLKRIRDAMIYKFLTWLTKTNKLPSLINSQEHKSGCRGIEDLNI